MASEIAKEFTEQIINSQFNQNTNGETVNNVKSPSSKTFTLSRSRERDKEVNQVSSSSYTLANDNSMYSNEVDLWLRGNPSPTESTGVQNSRVAVVQRSTLAPTSSLDANDMWYFMAMMLPLLSVNNCLQWRCTPSMVLNGAEIFLAHFSRFCGQARAHIRQIAQDQVARDLFATAMDVVLVLYAIGFLVLSLYQASIIA